MILDPIAASWEDLQLPIYQSYVHKDSQWEILLLRIYEQYQIIWYPDISLYSLKFPSTLS